MKKFDIVLQEVSSKDPNVLVLIDFILDREGNVTDEVESFGLKLGFKVRRYEKKVIVGKYGPLQIITDNKWKQFVYRFDLPEGVLNNYRLEWVEEDDGFFKYKNDWFHLSEFSQFSFQEEYFGGRKTKWNGKKDFSYSNGLLIKISDDGEQYKIAYFYVVS